jgi:hypothetical protein
LALSDPILERHPNRTHPYQAHPLPPLMLRWVALLGSTAVVGAWDVANTPPVRLLCCAA